MTGLIISAHGKLASAMLETVEMLTGTQENVRTIGFCPGDSLETLIEAYECALRELNCDGALILTDIRGGSPNNVALAMQKNHPEVRVIAGVNVPMALHILDMRDELALEDLAREAIDIGRRSIEEQLLPKT